MPVKEKMEIVDNWTFDQYLRENTFDLNRTPNPKTDLLRFLHALERNPTLAFSERKSLERLLEIIAAQYPFLLEDLVIHAISHIPQENQAGSLEGVYDEMRTNPQLAGEDFTTLAPHLDKLLELLKNPTTESTAFFLPQIQKVYKVLLSANNLELREINVSADGEFELVAYRLTDNRSFAATVDDLHGTSIHTAIMRLIRLNRK